jgi:predicted DNA-binding transcriptional regulator AlpA
MTSIITGGAPVRLFNEVETAARLGMSVAWLRKRRGLSLPPQATRCGRSVRYADDEIARFIAAQTVQSTQGGRDA